MSATGVWWPITEKEHDRIMARTVRDGECIRFQGSLSQGYGRAKVGSLKDGSRRQVRVHRAIWEYHHGRIPDGLLLMHSCDVRNCVNLAHLSVGTIADNQADMARKGRAVGRKIKERDPETGRIVA